MVTMAPPVSMPHSRSRMAAEPLSSVRIQQPQPATSPDGPRRLGLGLLDIEQPGQHPGLPGVSTTGRLVRQSRMLIAVGRGRHKSGWEGVALRHVTPETAKLSGLLSRARSHHG